MTRGAIIRLIFFKLKRINDFSFATGTGSFKFVFDFYRTYLHLFYFTVLFIFDEYFICSLIMINK